MSDELHHHRINNLVSGLIKRTESSDEQQHLQWEAVEGDAYELSLSRSSIRIESLDEDGRPPFRFSIMDEHGYIVESITSTRDSRWDEFDLRALYSAASRNHRRVDARLTELFEELKIPDPPPPSPDPWGATPTLSDDEPPF